MLIVNDGEPLEHAMQSVGADSEWLEGVLKKEGCTLAQVFIMTCGADKNYTLIRKEI
ncbi:putative uncharacterized protein [Ruminococcus sp. CAG:579]|nr:putative uncharacterized protein [Ruminococcus sp. CAG:579]